MASSFLIGALRAAALVVVLALGACGDVDRRAQPVDPEFLEGFEVHLERVEPTQGGEAWQQ